MNQCIHLHIHIMPLKPTLTKKQLTQIHGRIVKTPFPHILNPFLKLLSNSPTPQNAFPFYNQMLRHHPDSHNHYTFTHALKACTSAHAHRKGLQIHARVVKSGHFNDIFIQNSLLHLYVTVNDITSARDLFNSISFPDVVSWTTIVSGLSKCGFGEEAIRMFSVMNVKPNFVTLVSVVSACCGLGCGLGSFRVGKSVHGYCFRNFEENNIVLENSLLELYIKFGSLVSAQYLFDKMRRKDVVSWTTMVGGYAQRGQSDEAVKLFRQMAAETETETAETETETEIKPNEATIVNVLTACSSIAALSTGKWVHAYVNTRHMDFFDSAIVGNALINMYLKCGDVGMAVSVFKSLKTKDIISWSTIITGLAMNGHGKQALQLFVSMVVNGVPPDDVTFVGLLSACSHAEGLVDRGLMFFNSMRGVYGIVPRMQHYACVVDMYGRAGLLEEAEVFVEEMPVEAEGVVWGALLNGCKIHGDEIMFERIKVKVEVNVVDTKQVSVGMFALISNVYASVDKWERANEVRDVMRLKGLKKIAGYSWVENT